MFAALDLIASVLDASGKSGAHWHHRRNRKARAGTGRGFFVLRDDPSKQFQFVKTVPLHFMQFGNGSKII
jgi:hypothetical protein